jgi:hypothetical protein
MKSNAATTGQTLKATQKRIGGKSLMDYGDRAVLLMKSAL